MTETPRFIPHIPRSDALAEAGTGAESLTELFSRDPETWDPAVEARGIAAIRAQRERWAQLEASGQTRAKPKAGLAAKTSLSADDIGI